MRLKDKIALIVGAGQSPGEGLGNGRATVLRFAQEGAKVMAVDHNLSSAEETAAIARQWGGECIAFQADVTKEATLAAMSEAAQRRWGRIDVLRRKYRRRRCAARPDHRSCVRPHRHHQPARRDYGLQAGPAANARTACWRHHYNLIGRRLGAISECSLQSD